MEGEAMSNFHIFNTSNHPLYNHTINTYQNPYAVSTPEGSAGRAGSLFSVTGSDSATVLLSLISARISLRMNNPPGSGKTMYLSSIIMSIGGSSLLSNLTGSATVVRGGTLTSPVNITPANHNFSSANASVLQAQSSTSAISGGTTLMTMQLAPGAVVLPFNGSIVVPPGSSMCVSVVSSSAVIGLTITSVATVTWWEA
jgi:hypothetical protein